MDPEQSLRETKNKNEKPLYHPNSESASDNISKPPLAKQEETDAIYYENVEKTDPKKRENLETKHHVGSHGSGSSAEGSMQGDNIGNGNLPHGDKSSKNELSTKRTGDVDAESHSKATDLSVGLVPVKTGMISLACSSETGTNVVYSSGSEGSRTAVSANCSINLLSTSETKTIKAVSEIGNLEESRKEMYKGKISKAEKSSVNDKSATIHFDALQVEGEGQVTERPQDSTSFEDNVQELVVTSGTATSTTMKTTDAIYYENVEKTDPKKRENLETKHHVGSHGSVSLAEGSIQGDNIGNGNLPHGDKSSKNELSTKRTGDVDAEIHSKATDLSVGLVPVKTGMISLAFSSETGTNVVYSSGSEGSRTAVSANCSINLLSTSETKTIKTVSEIGNLEESRKEMYKGKISKAEKSSVNDKSATIHFDALQVEGEGPVTERPQDSTSFEDNVQELVVTSGTATSTTMKTKEMVSGTEVRHFSTFTIQEKEAELDDIQANYLLQEDNICSELASEATPDINKLTDLQYQSHEHDTERAPQTIKQIEQITSESPKEKTHQEESDFVKSIITSNDQEKSMVEAKQPDSNESVGEMLGKIDTQKRSDHWMKRSGIKGSKAEKSRIVFASHQDGLARTNDEGEVSTEEPCLSNKQLEISATPSGENYTKQSEEQQDKTSLVIDFDKRKPIIKHLELLGQVVENFPDITILVHPGLIEVSGVAKEVEAARSYLDSLLSSVHCKSTHCEIPYTSLLTEKKVKDFIFDKFKEAGIRCHWTVQPERNTILYYYMCEDELQKAEELISQCFITKTEIEPEIMAEILLKFPGECLKFEQDNETVAKLVYTSNIAEAIEEIITSEKNKRKSAGSDICVELTLGEFIMRHKEIGKLENQLNVKIISEKGQIVVTGEMQDNVKKAMVQIKDIADTSYTDYVIQEYPLDENSEEWQMIKQEAEENNVSIFSRMIRRGPLRDKIHYYVYGTDIDVGQGCIADLDRVDGIIVPVNNSLFPITAASELLIRKGGASLAEELKIITTRRLERHHNKPPEIGHVEISNQTGTLPCSYIFYIVIGEKYTDDGDLEIKLFLKLCHIFEEVHVRKQQSLAIPLELSRTFPVQTFSKTFAKAVEETGKQGKLPKSICLCAQNSENLSLAIQGLNEKFGQNIDEGDLEIIDTFDNVEDTWKNQVNVETITGSIVENKVDAIVCVIYNCNLQKGAVVKAILNYGGEEIKQELSHFAGATIGEVVATTGGRLCCKHVFFGKLPIHKDKEDIYALKNLKLFLKNTFQAAKKHNCRSLAFPVLGTGSLNYPPSMVAREIFRASHYYGIENGVNEVKFVLVSGDPYMKVFTEMNRQFNHMQKIQGCKMDGRKNWVVNIENLKTKITVVEGVDLESLVSDAVAKATQISLDEIREANQGTKLWHVQSETPNEYMLNRQYYRMSFSPSLAESDFKECLKGVMTEIEKKACEHVTLDFSEGLEGLHNYIKFAFDVFVSIRQKMKYIQTLKIVADEKTFNDVSEAESQATNHTFTGMLLSKIWPTAAPSILLKTHSQRFTNWLTVLYASDAQKLHTTRTKIDGYYKSYVGSSVDETSKDINPQTDSKRKDTGKSKSSQILSAEESEKWPGSSDPTSMNTFTSLELTETDSDDEIFGVVEAVLPVTYKTEEDLNTLKKSLTTCEGLYIQFNHQDSNSHVKFSYSQRYDVQNVLLGSEDNIDFFARKSLVIENVDENLYQLFLLYVNENKDSMKIKTENLKRDGNRIIVFGETEVYNIVNNLLEDLRCWNTESVGFKKEIYEKANETFKKLKAENPNVIVRLFENEIQISGKSEHTGPAKHKVNIDLGFVKTTGRNRRQFNEQSSILPQRNSLDSRLNTQPLADEGKSDDPAHKYQTDEGISVKVYKGNITNLPVDCIVNAANEDLWHGGGVAFAISKAAGQSFQDESSRWIQVHGRLNVTQCAKTSAGRLKYKHVIHAVGPRFTQYKTSTDAADDLKLTVINALTMAENCNMQSIAIPSISAGIFGGQAELCADMYIKGVLEFSRTRQNQHSLEEIHFVDVNEDIVKIIQSKFYTAFTLMTVSFTRKEDGKSMVYSSDATKSSHTKSGTDVSTLSKQEGWPDFKKLSYSGSVDYNTSDKTQFPSKFQTEDKQAVAPKTITCAQVVCAGENRHGHEQEKPSHYTKHQMPVKPHTSERVDNLHFDFPEKNGIKVSVREGDISLFSVDAVVCPEDYSNIGGNSIAKSIKKVINDKHIWEIASKQKSFQGSTFRASVKQGMPYKYVILVYSQRWKSAMTEEKFESDVKLSIKNIFKDLESADVKSLSLPLIGVGNRTTPLWLCCRILCDEILNFITSHDVVLTKLKQITVMSTNKESVEICKDLLSKGFLGNIGQSSMHYPVKKMVSHTSARKQCRNCKKLIEPFENSVDLCITCSARIQQRQIEAHQVECFAPVGCHPCCTMWQEIIAQRIPGYKCDTIRITYHCPDGQQTISDPFPMRHYGGCWKTAYLPNNEGGLIVLELFRKALENSLTFKVNQRNFVEWSGFVEHKTSLTAGPFGYPDRDYLGRVMNKLSHL